jgi:hypothetical protein
MFRLLSSTTVVGQTAAMISSLETRSPDRATSTPRTSSAGEPISIGTKRPRSSGRNRHAPVETEAFELENIVHGERVAARALDARPRLRKF